MKRKLIISVALTVCFAFSGCSYHQITENAKENSAEKSAILTSASISTGAALQKKVLARVIVSREKITTGNEKIFDKPEDIKIFTTAIETGTFGKNPGLKMKAPDYYADFLYTDGEKVRYLLYINKDNSKMYKSGSEGEFYTLTKNSIGDLTRLLFTEAEAIAKVIKDHPEFPSKAGVKESEEESGGPIGSKVSVKFETAVEKNSDNVFTVTLTKAWAMTVNGKKPVSFWKYDVLPEKVILVKEDTTGEELISIIK